MQALLGFIVILIILAVIMAIAYYLYYLLPLRKDDGGFEFVYVTEGGSVREVSEEEAIYLTESFHPADSGRPYVKSRYKDVDGAGTIAGFIRRRRVPAGIEIFPK